MRVIYVGSPPLFTRGASAIHVMKMCEAMARLGIQVELVLPSYDRDIDIFDYYNVEPNFKLSTLPSLKRGTPRHIAHGAIGVIYARLNRQSFDLVLTRNLFFAYLATNLFRIPTIYDAHHPPVDRIANYIFKSFKDSDNLLRFSTNSSGLGEVYRALGLREEKLVVAPNGVDLESFEDMPPKEEIRKQLGLPVEKKIVCYSGNLYTGRGIEQLIEVALELRDVLFLIVGGLESDIENYKGMARKRGAENLLFAGFVPQKTVKLYLSSADVLVMPYTSRMTIRDGTAASEFTSPIKLFEYMASGRPLVATLLPSVREILVDEKNSLLVEPDRVDVLRSAVKRLLQDDALAQQLAAQAVSDVKKYTWIERVKRIFRGLYFVFLGVYILHLLCPVIHPIAKIIS